MMKTFRFDEIAYNSTQKVKPTEADKEHYIGLEHIDGECLYISRWGSDIAPIGEKLVMRKGDILFGKRRAYQRKVAIAPIDGIFSAHGLVLRPKEDVVDKDYFPFFMSSNQFLDRAVQISVGGLSPTINWKDLARQEFTLPSLSEQKVLADKLWAAYRVKESYKKLLAATDDMLKAKFQEMFGDPVKNEKNWYVKSLSEVAPESASNHKLTGTVWNLNLDMIESGTGLLIEKVYIPHESLNSVVPFDEENVLYSKLRPYLNKVIIPAAKGYATTELVPLRPDTTLLNMKFLSYILRSEQFVAFANGIATGTKMPRIPMAELRKFNCILPPLPLQQQFVEIATQAEATKESLRKSIENIDQVIKSLINQ